MARTVSLKQNIGAQSTSACRRDDAPEGGVDPDRVLVARCARQDPAALHALVLRYQQRLYHFVRQMLGSVEDTEEAVQDIFVKVWQQAAHFEGRASFATWLYRIAANVAYDQLRRRKTQPVTTDLHEDMSAATVNAEDEALKGLERSEQAARLDQALGRLRAEDRLLLHLYYAEELEYAEIGQITGYAYPVLKVRLMRARRRLQAILGATAPEENE